MQQPYVVALVVDPELGEAIRPLAQTMHVCAVGSPINRAVAEDLWKSGPQPPQYDNESGITPFDYDPKSDRESWCRQIIDTIDQHHDQWSHDPPYTVLNVYGLQFSAALKPAFESLGFVEFQETAHGFCAIKSEP